MMLRKIVAVLMGAIVSLTVMIFCLTLHGCKDTDDDGNGPDTLARYTQHYWGPAWSPDGQTIAVGYVPWIPVSQDSIYEVWDSSGIYLLDANGQNKRPLLLSGIAAFLCYPDFSPSGEWLVYVGGPDGVNNIHKAKTNGESITQLTFLNEYWDRRPKWGPDGAKILFGRAYAPKDSTGLCLMDTNGANNKVLNEQTTANIAFGDFRPDYRIIFRGWINDYHGIWAIDTTGLNEQRIYSGSATDGVCCSPDGAKLTFCIYNDDMLRHEIWSMHSDGTNTRLLCFDGVDPCWSPDGERILFVRYNLTKQATRNPGYGELWIMNSDGSNQHQLTYLD